MTQGSLPALLGQCLKEEPFKSQINWNNWHVWFVDERYVPLDDAESNYKYVLRTAD
jgi:6-phosphogluconolactonase